MAQELKLMNYSASIADQCLFVPTAATEERVAVLLWVDDFVLMYESEQTASSFLARLRQRFNIPTVGPVAQFLGMDISYKPETRKMFLSQQHTIDVLLERARMQDCNPAQTPSQYFRRKTAPPRPRQEPPSMPASLPSQITSRAGLAPTLRSQ
jgi:hypothetical protein